MYTFENCTWLEDFDFYKTHYWISNGDNMNQVTRQNIINKLQNAPHTSPAFWLDSEWEVAKSIKSHIQMLVSGYKWINVDWECKQPKSDYTTVCRIDPEYTEQKKAEVVSDNVGRTHETWGIKSTCVFEDDNYVLLRKVNEKA